MVEACTRRVNGVRRIEVSVFLSRSAVGFGKLSGLAETTLLAFKINKFFCQEKKSCTL